MGNAIPSDGITRRPGAAGAPRASPRTQRTPAVRQLGRFHFPRLCSASERLLVRLPCAQATWAAQTCLRYEEELAGRTCDQDATDAVTTAVRSKALNTAESNCSERQLSPLEYLGSFDMQTDIVKFCRDWPMTAASTVYAPVQSARRLSPAQRDCVAATADVVDSILQFSFRDPPSVHGPHRLNRPGSTEPDLAARIRGETYRRDAYPADGAPYCALRSATFATLYPLTPEALVENLSTRADCIGGQLYIQNAVLCPNPVCGNGIVEPGEDCDDGNATGGDACPSNCRLQ